MRELATAIVILLLVPSRSGADLDLSIGGSVRSYALSGVIDVNTGYGILLWGNPATAWYGYLRPQIDANTTVTYNSADAGLEFYPLSFLGGRVGGEAVQNDSHYTAYDCTTYDCLGRFHRTYALANLSLGFGPIFLQMRWKREHWSERTPGVKRFIEPTSGFALSSSGDAETVYRGTLGWKFTSTWALLGMVVYAQNDSDRGISRMPLLFVRYTQGPLMIGLGGGTFHSPLKPESGTAFGFLSWEIAPSLALH